MNWQVVGEREWLLVGAKYMPFLLHAGFSALSVPFRLKSA